MRLVTYVADDALRAGIELDGRVVDAERAVGERWAATVVGILEQPQSSRDALALAAQEVDGLPIDSLRLAPPIPAPQKIICIGLNYVDHVHELEAIKNAPSEVTPVPILFTKFVTSLVGHEDLVLIPPSTEQMDYEAELAVVIGRRASRVSAIDALSYVGGYSAFNDITARDLQLRTPQWTAGKAPDTFGPFGPVLVTADEIADPQSLRIQCRVNGEARQDATTDLMIFPVAQLIEFISSLITLVPGDVISTGTPAGIGVARKPPLFLQAGDVVEVEISQIGVLRNTLASLQTQ
ncbi:unannotated protein [freshwater metagenome]|uniref:Unannotated protein n=1 Tax=freshwater metagenome TaxID=449393 RepID=A0A6J7E927_9ZZZZ|nr:hypothetical protein [Actinomycetota bacterium]